MITCPVCEHPQAAGGRECEGCGKVFARVPAGGVAAPVARIPELEGTRHAAAAAPVPAVGLLPELEVTHHASEPDWGGADVPDLEVTRHEPAAMSADATSLLAEVELHRAPTDGQKTVLPAEAGQICRYCRHMQPTGLMCDRCGMRLPRIGSAAAPTQAAGRKGKADPVKTRCRSCGAPATAGGPCGDCGRFVPIPEP